MRLRVNLRRLAAVAALALVWPGLVEAEELSFKIAIVDHKFMPNTLEVPAGKTFTLAVTNSQTEAAEFECSAFRIEKVVPQGGTITLTLGPMPKGRWQFVDDFHEKTKGYFVAK